MEREVGVTQRAHFFPLYDVKNKRAVHVVPFSSTVFSIHVEISFILDCVSRCCTLISILPVSEDGYCLLKDLYFLFYMDCSDNFN